MLVGGSVLFENRVDLDLMLLNLLPDGRGLKRELAGCDDSKTIFSPVLTRRVLDRW